MNENTQQCSVWVCGLPALAGDSALEIGLAEGEQAAGWWWVVVRQQEQQGGGKGTQRVLSNLFGQMSRVHEASSVRACCLLEPLLQCGYFLRDGRIKT